MKDQSLALILTTFMLIGTPVLFLNIRKRRENSSSTVFTLLCLSNTLWSFFNILFYIVPDVDLALLFFETRLVFICYSTIFIYLLALKCFKHILPSTGTIISLCCIPLITLAMVLTNSQLHLLREYIAMEIVDGVRTVVTSNGPWFWVHCVVCYTFTVLVFRLLLMQFFRLPKGYRLSITTMLIAVFSTTFVSALAVFSIMPFHLDLSPAVAHASQILFFYTLYRSHSLDMLFVSRDTIFENSSYAIFILDVSKRIVDYNNKASELGRYAGIPSPYGTSYDELFGSWLSSLSSRYFEEDKSVFSVTEDGADSHYQVATTDIVNNSGAVIGSYIEIKNITPIMSLVHKLQDFAYYDQLTSLFNRHSFAIKSLELDTPEHYPLGIICGDVNRLKLVNDSYGHAAGDLLLQTITEILKASSPPALLWFRVGGDEFVGLCPNADTDTLDALLRRIWSECRQMSNPQFLDSDIALAYKMKTSPDEDLTALLHDADRSMYENKYDRRRT